RGGEGHRRGGRIGEPHLDDRVCETVVNLAVEPLGDLVWRTPRYADTLPRARFEAGHDVAYRWDVGQSTKSGLASHAQSTERTRSDVRKRGRHRVECDLHVSTKQIGHHRRGPAIGYMNHIDACHHLEQLACDMR